MVRILHKSSEFLYYCSLEPVVRNAKFCSGPLLVVPLWMPRKCHFPMYVPRTMYDVLYMCLVMLVLLLKLRVTSKCPSFSVAGWQGLGSNQVTTGFLVELHSSQVDRAANRQIGCILAIGGFS